MKRLVNQLALFVALMAIPVTGCDPKQAKPEKSVEKAVKKVVRMPVHADRFLKDGEVWCFYESEVDSYNEAPLIIHKLREIPWDQILQHQEKITLRANATTYKSLEAFVGKEKEKTLKEQGRSVHYMNMYRLTEHANIDIFPPLKE